MNILGQGYPTFEHLNLQTGREQPGGQEITGVHATDMSGSYPNGDSVPLSMLTEGQIFRGQVLDITSQGIKIQLNPEQILFARLGEQVELNIGQQMAFQVRENKGDQLIIHPMQNENAGSIGAAERALTANGFSHSERNIQIVQNMMREGMPLNRESIRVIMQQAIEYPSADIRQLVAMNRLNIPITEANIKQFQAYAGGEHRLTMQTDTVLQSVENILQNMSAESQPEQLPRLNQALLEIFNWQASGETGNPSETGAASVINQNPEADEAWMASLRQNLETLGVPREDAVTLVRNDKSAGQMLADITQYLTEHLGKNAIKQSGNPENPMTAVEQNLNALQAFLQSDDYRGLLTKGIRDSWGMRPDRMRNPKEIDELYETMFSQSSKMEEAFQSAGFSHSDLSKNSQNMRENLRFMQDLNQQFVYAQVPLNLEDGQANSELFVYTRRKQARVSEDGTRVLLHLDMPSLGMTDILVSLRDQQLHARFTVEDEQSAEVIRSHMQELQEKLETKGFIYTNEVQKAERKSAKQEPEAHTGEDTVVTEMMKAECGDREKRYTFDMRT